MIYEVWYSIYDLERRLEKLEKSKNFVHSWQKRLIRRFSSQGQERRLKKLKKFEKSDAKTLIYLIPKWFKIRSDFCLIVMAGTQIKKIKVIRKILIP